MTDVLLVSVGLIMLIGVVAFYFHGRLAYTDKKIGLLENLLMDIKMTLDVEAQGPSPHEHFLAGAPASATLSGNGPKFVPLSETVEDEEIADGGAAAVVSPQQEGPSEVDYYSAVIQQAAGGAATAGAEPASEVPTVNYEAQTRDELVALAERRGLRVTKRMGKPQIVSLLRDADKRPGPIEEGGVVAALGGPEPAGGAPLDADAAPQEVSLDD